MNNFYVLRYEDDNNYGETKTFQTEFESKLLEAIGIYSAGEYTIKSIHEVNLTISTNTEYVPSIEYGKIKISKKNIKQNQYDSN